jgi:hypothetical protein
MRTKWSSWTFCETGRVVDGGLPRHGTNLDSLPGDIHLPDLAEAPDEDVATVRAERVAGIEAVDRPGLLQILVELVEQGPALTGREVLEV